MGYNYQFINVSGGGVIGTSEQTCVLELKNTGDQTWQKSGANPFRLGTDRTQNHPCPVLKDTLSSSRIELDQTSVAPGANGTFTFKVQFPVHLYGGEKHYFTPVVNGLAWLTDIGMYWDWYRPPERGIIMFTWYGPKAYRWNGLYPDFSTQAEDIPVLPVSPVDLKARYGHNGEHMGRYDSSDPDVIRWQLNEILDLHCSFVVLDYWPQHSWINDVSFAVAEMIRDEFPNLKYTYLIDGAEPITTDVLDDIDTNGVITDDQFFKKYANQKPTVYVWGNRTSSDTRFNYETIGPALLWPGDTPQHAWRTFIGQTRFDNSHGNPGTVIEYDKPVTGGYADTFCNYAVGQRRNLDTVLWYGLNEYYEGAQIEKCIHKDAPNVPSDRLFNKVKNANNVIKTTL